MVHILVIQDVQMQVKKERFLHVLYVEIPYLMETYTGIQVMDVYVRLV